jgi:hypothetical protein
MNTRIDPRTAELIFWLLVCSGLAGLIGQQINWGHQLHAPEIAIIYEPAKYTAPAISFALNIEPSERYLEIVERPLFIFTRRPAPPPPPPVPPSMMKKGQFKLSGVSITGDQKLAFLVEIATKKTKVVREGEKINDMTMANIEPGGVTLVLGTDQEQLGLAVALSSKSISPGTAPAAISTTAGSPAR